MSPWTHHRNEMFGEVVNFLMLILREKKIPFLQLKAGTFWGASIRGGWSGLTGWQI